MGINPVPIVCCLAEHVTTVNGDVGVSGGVSHRRGCSIGTARRGDAMKGDDDGPLTPRIQTFRIFQNKKVCAAPRLFLLYVG